MRIARFVVVVGLAACGGAQPSGGGGPGGGSGTGSGVVTDTRTAFEQRLEAACTALGPRLTRCAVEDAQAQLAAGQITQRQYDDTTKPDLQAALTRDWDDKCYRPDKMTSRQVRILEVCAAEETQCDPLLDCLANLATK